ncbi:MAG: cephalosporin hydroxylase family protein [Methanocorpusculum sp.]|uniref:Cephalosporin hydroxylase family protein n=1 Tax=Methanocorpusculum petauri TaxID=3002863 RepID=A0ABT4IDQ1_9EURY|nr:cephalosporin hydroxylase family protein [Methanocorpusculum petauri]MCZ0859865.1 cephalosporin hydroxylase family protein [Methanocorpusculum petauri]MDE2518226.1 cephalosporin hydroxylase family protein [Methanocorpusculum sp.]MDE2521749.1 cephalosporin hydroxylase family protein [Methanocorpusculum sp.]
MNPIEEFQLERKDRISSYHGNTSLQDISRKFTEVTIAAKYQYNFSWLGRPTIHYPQDLVAMQEIIWNVKPDLIIETGIAHGGSLIFSASMLELLGGEDREVVGLDIDIRAHNRAEIEAHPLFKRITLIEGDSTSPEIAEQVYAIAQKHQNILVCLDSNHTHDHVLKELELYSPLVSTGSYCIVFDTIIEDLPDDMFSDRPWCHGNNPKTAVWEFLKTHDEFSVDAEIIQKLLVTEAPDGYLKKIK